MKMTKRKLKPIPIALADIGVKPDDLYYDDRETWDLFTVISHFVYPRLVRFKECDCGYPGMMTPEQWDETLDKMILAFKNIIVHNSGFECTDEINAEITEGLELFAKYFRHLWY